MMLQSTTAPLQQQLRRPALSSSRSRSSSLTTRALFGFGKESEAARQKRLEKEEQFRLQQEVLQSRRSGAWKKVRKREKEREKERACFSFLHCRRRQFFRPPRPRPLVDQDSSLREPGANQKKPINKTGRRLPPRQGLQVPPRPGLQEGDRRGAPRAPQKRGRGRAAADRVPHHRAGQSHRDPRVRDGALRSAPALRRQRVGGRGRGLFQAGREVFRRREEEGRRGGGAKGRREEGKEVVEDFFNFHF